ncbi:MAG TPA: DsrE family protein [Steroidobacteraceae bacterium]|nr:DsrE family protein [Steroidobacteraceae bacterium]
MTAKPCLTFLLMDPPFESARTTTAFRLIHSALAQGHDVKVFAYEGAVSLAFARQAAHANGVHGRDAAQEAHPLTREWIAFLQADAGARGARLEWVNCGLCVDERGVGETVPEVRRGSPVDFLKMVKESVNTLVVPTR